MIVSFAMIYSAHKTTVEMKLASNVILCLAIVSSVSGAPNKTVNVLLSARKGTLSTRINAINAHLSVWIANITLISALVVERDFSLRKDTTRVFRSALLGLIHSACRWINRSRGAGNATVHVILAK